MEDNDGNKNPSLDCPDVPSSDELCKKYGWSVRMDHRFPDTWDSVCLPRLKQIPDLLPLFVRLVFKRELWIWKKMVQHFIGTFAGTFFGG